MTTKETLRKIRKGRKTERIQNPIKYNETIRSAWMPIWVRNAFENYPRLKEMFLKEDHGAEKLVEKTRGKDALIIGSGPSVRDWFPYLKDFGGDIICSSSHLVMLETLGVKPDYCVIIDADPSMLYLVSEADTEGITLVTHPNMDTRIIDMWKGPKYFFRMQDPGDPWFNEYMPLAFTYFAHPAECNRGVHAYVLNSGNVCNTAVALARGHLEYKHIFLAGIDLGYPDGLYRFGECKRGDDGKMFLTEAMPITPEMVTSIGSNGIPTDRVSIFYKYSFMVL